MTEAVKIAAIICVTLIALALIYRKDGGKKS